jgi:hypothetical protein
VGKNFMLVIEQINNMKDLEGLLFRMLPKQKLTDKGKKPTESLSHSQ